MKAIITLAVVFLITAQSMVFAEVISPEITKIDERLDELRTIWRQEQAIINGHTRNRTVPVREGSREYHACLAAEQRIRQAEAEAKTLQERKARIAATGSEDESETKTQSPDQDTEAKPTINLRNFNFEEVRDKSNSKKETTLVFKSFYLGMPSEDALGLINHFMDLPQVAIEPVAPAQVNIFNRDGKGPYHIVKIEENLIIAKSDYPDRPFAILDANGNVKEFRISTDIRDKFFGLKETPLDEFIQTFINNYNVPEVDGSREPIEYFGDSVGAQNFYTHRSEKGFEVKFFGDLAIFDQQKFMELSMLGIGNHGEVGSFTVKSIQTMKERSGNFD